MHSIQCPKCSVISDTAENFLGIELICPHCNQKFLCDDNCVQSAEKLARPLNTPVGGWVLIGAVLGLGVGFFAAMALGLDGSSRGPHNLSFGWLELAVPAGLGAIAGAILGGIVAALVKFRS